MVVQCAELELGWAGGLGSRHARTRSARGAATVQNTITFSISIAVKIRKMGHMVNFVFDGEFSSLKKNSAQGSPSRATHLRAGCPDYTEERRSMGTRLLITNLYQPTQHTAHPSPHANAMGHKQQSSHNHSRQNHSQMNHGQTANRTIKRSAALRSARGRAGLSLSAPHARTCFMLRPKSCRGC
jgi:hypothetical protein